MYRKKKIESSRLKSQEKVDEYPKLRPFSNEEEIRPLKANDYATKWADICLSHIPAHPSNTDSPELRKPPLNFTGLAEGDRSIQRRKESMNPLPPSLKFGLQSITNIPLDDISIFYDSPEPARIHALAFTQGNSIYLGPGQEEHLPHEAWHAIQQRQGRVQPTLQGKSGPINIEKNLEVEADAMGAKAMQLAAAWNREPAQQRVVRQNARQDSLWAQSLPSKVTHAYSTGSPKQLLVSDEQRKLLWMANEIRRVYEIDEGTFGPLVHRLLVATDLFEALLELRSFVGREMSQVRISTVSKTAMKRLKLADEAIAHAKSKISWGASNQLDAVFLSQGNSKHRAAVGKNSKHFGYGYAEENTATVARQAEIARAATCREYTALVYEFLKAKKCKELQIVSISQPLGHTFVVIGELSEPDAVAVDAWPTIAQAVLLRDHFSRRNPDTVLSPGNLKPATKKAGPPVIEDTEQMAEKLTKKDPFTLPQGYINLNDSEAVPGLHFVPGGTGDLRRIRYQTAGHLGKSLDELHSEWFEESEVPPPSKAEQMDWLAPFAKKEATTSKKKAFEEKEGKYIHYKGAVYAHNGDVDERTDIIDKIDEIESKKTDATRKQELLRHLEVYKVGPKKQDT